MTDNTLDQLREAKRIDRLQAENARLRTGLLEAVMTFNRADPFYKVFMERYGDLLPIRRPGDAA